MPFVQEVQAALDKSAGRMDKTIEHFNSEMGNIRAGRANPQILNKVTVNYYGTQTPITQMANISVTDARTLAISVWDQSAVKDVVKAILASDIGITPNDDGKVIRLIFPQPTEERRKELVKGIKKTTEDCKIAIRNERRDIMEVVKKLQKDSVISEDELKTVEKEVQTKLLDKYIAMLDKLSAAKEKEILEV